MKKMIAVLMVAVTLTLCFGGALFVANNTTAVVKLMGGDPEDLDDAIIELLPAPGGDKIGKGNI